MGLYTKFIANVIFPLHEILKKHQSVKVRNELERSQWLSPIELKACQSKKLQQFINEVYQHVPYYRDIFDTNNIDPQSIKSSEDLAQLPLLSKAEIKDHFEEFKANNAGELSKGNTGGSSGSPLIFLFGKDRTSHDVGSKWRATRWWNVDIGDKEIVAWGSPIELGAQDKVKAVRDSVMRTKLIPAFDMNEQKINEFLKEIKQFKPAMLFGYPSVFDLLAKHAEKNNMQMDNLGIKVAFVTSERLYDHQRENIERVFGCPVANGYGGRDAGFIAHQCPAGGMHITSEDIIVELLDPKGNPVKDGEAGEIVTTHLSTKDFPFIRYRTGDIAIYDHKPCSCGRGLPLLKEIQGRTTDFIVAEDGTIMHGLALIYVLREQPFVDDFKIVQETQQLIHLQLVSENHLNQEQQDIVISGLKQRLGQGVNIIIEQVDAIAPEKSGKFRYVISKVAV